MKTLHSYLLFSFLALCALLCSSCAKDTTRSDIALEMTEEDSVEAIIDQDLLTAGSTAIDVSETAGKTTSDVSVAYVDEVDLQKPVLVETDESLRGDAARGTGTTPGTDATMMPPLTEGAITGADLPDAAGSGAIAGSASPDADLARLAEEARSPALPATGMSLESPQRYAPGSASEPIAVRPPGSGYAASYYRTDQLPASYPRHTVQRGDSLWSVSKKYGCSISELAAANGISRGSILSVGQSLLIPVSKSPAQPAASTTDTTTPGAAPTTALQPATTTTEQPATPDGTATPAPRAGAYETEYYTVQQGDSYWKIARQYGVTSTELMSLNDTSDSRLKIGQKVLVPKKQ